LTVEQVARIKQLLEQDPHIFAELLNRRKWSSITKNPEKAIRMQFQNNKFWNLLNDMPEAMIKNIITPHVLNMDLVACN